MSLELIATGVVRDPKTGQEKEIEIVTGLIGSAEQALVDGIRWQFEQDAREIDCVPVRFSGVLTARTHSPVRYP